jgi:hypothetical protein
MAHVTIIPDSVLAARLLALLEVANPAATPWNLLLWTGSYVPVPGVVIGDLTEATFQGYVRRTMQRADWGTPVVAAGCAESEWGTEPLSWTSSGGPTEVIAGCAFVDAVTGALERVERFADGDQLEVAPGSTYQIVPKYSLTSAEC